MKIMTRQKNAIAFLLTVALLLTSQYLYARAGGGGGGGGGGGRGSGILGLILAPFMLLYYMYRRSVIKNKKEASDGIIALAEKEDAIWNESKLEAHARDIFFKMQQAWMDRNMGTVKKIISSELYESYKTQLDFMKTNHEKNILEGISVNTISIIGVEDYKDNTKDSYSALLEGNMVDYTINEQSGNVVKNSDKKNASFADTYHFVRQGNEWILNNITNDPSLSSIENAVSYKEE